MLDCNRYKLTVERIINMKTIPKIEKYMTASPHSVGNDIPLKKAYEMMRGYGVRHLPVYHGGKLVGVLTDRDVKLATSFKGSEDMLVDDVMTPDPYAVAPDAPIDRVAIEMSEHKYGCAIIQQTNGKVVGIFTVTDALRALSEVIHQNYKP